MNNLLFFMSRSLILMTVFIFMYILPALIAFLITFDTEIYVSWVTNPGYGACMTLMSLIAVFFYIDIYIVKK